MPGEVQRRYNRVVKWGTHDAPPARRSDPPAPRLVEMYWRAVGPSRKELNCGVYRIVAGLELRCGYGSDQLMRSTRIGAQDDGRTIAAGWLHLVLSNGWFELLESTVDEQLEELRASLNVASPSGMQH